MTIENGPHGVRPSSADLLRSMAVSSPELWQSTPLDPVSADPPDAASADPPDPVSADPPDAASPEPFEVPSLRADDAPDAPPAVASDSEPVLHPETPPPPGEDLPLRFKDSGGPADSFITSVEAPAPWAWSGAAEVQEPAVETGVPEPVFYVPSFDEEVLPATSVAELSASALDAVLDTEFGAETVEPVRVSGITSPANVDRGDLSMPEPETPHADTPPTRARRREGADQRRAGADWHRRPSTTRSSTSFWELRALTTWRSPTSTHTARRVPRR